jgi:catechol 2,3-dioxygenase-like lactoylglutathione lyase family enzyme
MDLAGIDHYTLRCRPDEMDGLRDFYGDILGLKPGPRPDFSFPGHWLYLAGAPVVHIAATLPADAPTAQPGQTGRFDHLSFTARDVPAVEAHLNARAIAFKGNKVPGFPLSQLFFYDPVGVKVELTFRVESAA